MVASENRLVSPRIGAGGGVRCDESWTLPADSIFATSCAPATGASEFLQNFGDVELFGDDADRIAEVRKLLQVADLFVGHIAGHDVAEHRNHIDHVVGRERVLGEIFARLVGVLFDEIDLLAPRPGKPFADFWFLPANIPAPPPPSPTPVL